MDFEKYKFIIPLAGYIVLKKVEQEQSILVKGNLEQDRCYAYVANLPEKFNYNLTIGDIVVYDEFEGQELYRSDKIKEEGIVLIKQEKIIAKLL